ncbi:hypothetical protein SELMODRAFT_422672 [Selaginella moellendorffii]|uniref:Protein kinase domain-containing protein n=1 Tax=Selaginella moellendorffii TaxID=88036 RepID=D8SJ63_SELML|nr:hypothetical protein SELMODRAFT_422672 [Selaginella moellendorffii]
MCQHTPRGGYKVWDSFASELQDFYSQPDNTPMSTDPCPLHVAAGATSRDEAFARLYASLVVPVQQLSYEYQKRFQAGSRIHLSHCQGAVVMYGTLDSTPSLANTGKGYLLVESDEVLQVGIDGGSNVMRKVFDRAAGYIYHGACGRTRSGYACVTSLERSFFCKLTHDDVLLVSDAFFSPTFMEALFYFMHLLFERPPIVLGEEAADPSDFIVETNTRNKRYVVDMRIQTIKLCRLLNFKPKDIEAFVMPQLPELDFLRDVRHLIHSGGKVSVFRGDLKSGRKAIVKVCNSSDQLEEAVREVWMMVKLKDLQGDVIPRLYAAGFMDGGLGWVTIMQDIGGMSIDKDCENLRPYLSAAKSALTVMHRANVSHGRVVESNIIVSREGGKVMWIDLGAACLFDKDEDADEFLQFAKRDQRHMEKLFRF